MRVPVDLTTIFEDTHWKKLEKLCLCVATVSENVLCSFLKTHTSSLRKVKLQNMWLSDEPSGWDHIFEIMKTDLSLNAVQFLGVWGAESADGCKMIRMEGERGKKIAKSILSKTLTTQTKKSGRKGRRSMAAKAEKSSNMEELFDSVGYTDIL